MSGLKEAMNAVRENPKHAGSWVALGEILLAEHQLEKATQSFQRALQLEPTNSAAQRGLAQILLAGSGGASASARPTPSTGTPRPAATTPPPAASRPPVSQTPLRSDSRTPPPRAQVPPRSVATPPPTPSAPLMRDTEIPRAQRGVAAPMELRTPPPRPKLPSPGRVRLGLFFLALIPLLCICVAAFALAKIF